MCLYAGRDHTRRRPHLFATNKCTQVDARIAAVAVHLGMTDDAVRLYAGCKRYDLLNQLYQAGGQWDKALETAEKHDRIHLKVVD